MYINSTFLEHFLVTVNFKKTSPHFSFLLLLKTSPIKKIEQIKKTS